jgi:hypothetical protein
MAGRSAGTSRNPNERSTGRLGIGHDDPMTARFVTMSVLPFCPRENMGSKPSHALPSNRPESGGTDPNGRRENTGLEDRDKEAFAKSHAAQSQKKKSEPASDNPETESDEKNR